MALFRMERVVQDIRDPSHSLPNPVATMSISKPARASGSADNRLAELGLRSLADLLAPPSVVIADDHLLLDGQYARVLAVTELPPVVPPGGSEESLPRVCRRT